MALKETCAHCGAEADLLRISIRHFYPGRHYPSRPSAAEMSAPAGEPAEDPAVSKTLAHARSKVALLINPVQQNNPVLRYIRHVRKEVHSGISSDYVCGPTVCVLYLSLQYHKLHPGYIYKRIKSLGSNFRLRILLVLADVVEHRSPLHELTKLSLVHGVTLVCTTSEREAARYLETLRSYDGKGAEGIQERVGTDYASRLNAAFSSVRGVNKTDITTLAYTFGSVKDIALAGQDELRQCPGIGERKVARLHAALHQPFRADNKEMPAEEG